MMTQDMIAYGNKLMADFMGVKIGTEIYSWRPGCYEPLKFEHLNYHGSFSWLMSVMDKIESLGYSTMMKAVNANGRIEYETNIYDKSGDLLIEEDFGQQTRLESYYHAIVGFIQEYNKLTIKEETDER